MAKRRGALTSKVKSKRSKKTKKRLAIKEKMLADLLERRGGKKKS